MYIQGRYIEWALDLQLACYASLIEYPPFNLDSSLTLQEIEDRSRIPLLSG